VLKIRMRNCPHCNSSNVYISRPKHLWEELAILLLLRPVRCHYCALRHYRPLFVATDLPEGSTIESRKTARQTGPADRDEQRSA
jgi:hypothetical protein